MTGRNGIDKKERKFFRLCLYRMEEAQMKKAMPLWWRWKDGINGINGFNGNNGIIGINGTIGINGINGINGTKPPLPLSHQPAQPNRLHFFPLYLSLTSFCVSVRCLAWVS
jgi:hypothetical protein